MNSVTQMVEVLGCNVSRSDESPDSEADLVGSFITMDSQYRMRIWGRSRLITSATSPADASAFMYKLRESKKDEDKQPETP
ncbi:hypothetical protein BGZ94_003607 [Podila epigama]|nr:hypothetical protein BGZ94_003607 [Podila epigama]